MSPWVVSLRHMGYSVFAKPKRTRADDVDGDIARHIERRFAQGSLVELIVASHDASAFAEPLRRYAKAGVSVLVLGYREKDTFAASSPDIIFWDMEDVPGAFERPLPRTNLFDLPTAGRWFEPFPPPPAPDRVGASAARAGEPDPGLPDRNAVLELIEIEVRAATGQGSTGLGLREVGDFLRQRFPTFKLDDLGFAGVADLVDAIERPGRLRVNRLEDGSHHVSLHGPFSGETRPAPKGEPSTAEDEPATAEHEPSTAEPEPATAEHEPSTAEPEPAPEPTREPPDLTDGPTNGYSALGGPFSPPTAAESPERSDPVPPVPAAPAETPPSPLALIGSTDTGAESEPTQPEQPERPGGEEAEETENPPADSPGQHPIYRVFGIDRPA
jgi:hypothetical protein